MIYRRYLLSTYLRSFLFAFFAFSALYGLGEFLDRIDNFIDAKAPAQLYLRYFANIFPIIAITVAPLATLLASFMTIGHFERSNELTAMRTGGLSLKRLITPIILAAFVTSCVLFLVNEFSVPINKQEVKRINSFELKGKKQKTIAEKIWFQDGNSMVNISSYDPRKEYMEGVSVSSLDPESGSLLLSQTAQSASFNHLDGNWQGEGLILRTFDGENNLTSFRRDERGTLLFKKKPRDLEQLEGRAEELSLRRLLEVVSELKQLGQIPRHHLIEIHSRIAIPFTCLIMALIGIPFALQKGRKSTLGTGIGFSVAIGIIFQIVTSILMASGKTGLIPPTLAAWGGNIIFLLLALKLLRSNDL